MKRKLTQSFVGMSTVILFSVLILLGILLSCTSEGTPDETILNLVLAWNSDEDLDSAGSNDNDIFYARSTDGGTSWSSTQVLNSTAATDGDFDVDGFSSLLTDGKGVWVVVWESNADVDGADNDMDLFFSRSTDDGETWSNVAHFNTNAASDAVEDRRPHIFTDGTGVWIVVWEVNDDGAFDVFFSRSVDNGVSWSAPQVLRTNAGQNLDDRFARTATDGHDTWVTVWRSEEDLGGIGTDNDIVLSRSIDKGQNWSEPKPVNSTAGTDGTTPDHRPDLITDGNGVWVVVWFSQLDVSGSNTDSDILVSRSIDNGVSWSDAAFLNSNFTNADSDWRPRVMTDGKGTWITVWASEDDYQDAGSDRDIFFSRSTDNGQSWSAVQHLNTNAAADSGEDIRPSIAYLGQDIWVAVWESRENLNGAGATDDDIFFSRSTDGGVTWSAPQLLNDNAASDSGDDQFGYNEPS